MTLLRDAGATTYHYRHLHLCDWLLVLEKN